LEPSVIARPNGFGNSSRKISPPNKKEEEPPKVPAIHLADALPGAIATRATDESGVRLAGATAPAGVATLPIAGNASSAAGDRTRPNSADTRQKIFVPASALLQNAIAQPPPVYPALARIERVEGDVLLQALVDEKGKVEAVTVVNGPEPLRNAAIDALRNWRFKPYLLEGHPVAVRTFVDFHFKMNQ
jgi:protein TonB